jgi:hypothetical protein
LWKALNVHPNAGELDISEYDSGLSRTLIEMVAKLRLRMLSVASRSAWKKALVVYYENIIDSIVVLDGGEIVQKTTGNPSGQVNTITDNSLALMFAWFYAWVVLNNSDIPNTWSGFKAHVVLFCCGDDSIWTCSDEVKEWFNPRTVGNVFGSLGWKFKLSNLDYKPLKDTEFCSMTWHEEDGVVYPKPAFGKTISSLLCKNKSESKRMTLLRALALRLESWYNLEARDFLQDFIQWTLFKYRREMEIAPLTASDPFPLNDVMKSYKTPLEVEELYQGGENHLEMSEPLKFVVRENPGCFSVLESS